MEKDKKPAGCGSHCEMCQSDTISSASTDSPGPLRGFSLVIASMLVFILPLVFAILGGVILSGSQSWRFVGSLTGLVFGMMGAIALTRILTHQAAHKK